MVLRLQREHILGIFEVQSSVLGEVLWCRSAVTLVSLWCRAFRIGLGGPENYKTVAVGAI